MSKGEDKLGEILKRLFEFHPIVSQHTIASLTYDFYVPNLFLLAEFDGIQHSEASEFFHKDSDGWEKQKTRDKKRWIIAKTNGLYLIVVSEKELNKKTVMTKVIESYTDSNFDELSEDFNYLSTARKRQAILKKYKGR